jgi:F-type H+-transporting ATPase subunit b
MVTQAYAQEAATPTDDTAVHADHSDTHATVSHGDGHSDVFPPFDPATFPSQLLWLAICFAALYLLMSKLALPKVTKTIETRQATIAADLSAADADRQKTDAAIASYEKALAEAKSKAQAIAAQTRDAINADITAKRTAAEAELTAKVTEAEARIAATKAAALTNVDEIAADTAQAVVSQIVGDVSADSVRAAVAKVKG